MKYLAVAVFLVALAYTNAQSTIGIEDPLKAELEGGLGGRWIPDDTPVVRTPVAAPIGYAVPYGAQIVLPTIPRASLEGYLGGQWIPDRYVL